MVPVYRQWFVGGDHFWKNKEINELINSTNT